MGILDVPNPDGKLRISMTTQVNIVLAEVKDALVIPSAALGDRKKDGTYTVSVEMEQGILEKKQVQIGLNNNVQAVVLKGLHEGEKVVIGDKPAAGTADTSSSRRPMLRMR